MSCHPTYHILSPRPTPSLSLPTPVSRQRIPFKFLPLLVPLFHLLYFPRRKTYPLPMLQADAPSRQEQHLVSLADGHTYVIRRRGCISEVLLADISRLLFVPVSTTISTDGWRRRERCTGHDIRREKEKRQQWETTNVDAQEAVLGFLSVTQPCPFPPGQAPGSSPPPAQYQLPDTAVVNQASDYLIRIPEFNSYHYHFSAHSFLFKPTIWLGVCSRLRPLWRYWKNRSRFILLRSLLSWMDI